MENNFENIISRIVRSVERHPELPVRENQSLMYQLNMINTKGYLPDKLYDTVYEINDFLDSIDNSLKGIANA